MDGFWLICDRPDHCHCDWRVTIVECIENKAMFYIYIVNIVWSLLITITGTSTEQKKNVLFYVHYKSNNKNEKKRCGDII